jgi:hypothetical protein
MNVQHLALISALAIGAPTVTLEAAQWGRGGIISQGNSAAVREGRDRGIRAGEEDGRRNESYSYADESDYRRGDLGYRSQYGDRNRYRDQFRRAYVDGYAEGYERTNRTYSNRGGRAGVPPPWANGRGRGAVPRGGIFNNGSRNDVDLAIATGYMEGYEAGLDDGRDNRRNAPTAESRYRDGDRGYKREYGDRETYRLRYRNGFIEGYQDGYADGRYR